MTFTGAICGCSFVQDKFKKDKLTKEDWDEIYEHVFNLEHPCYWCGYDLEGAVSGHDD